MRLAKGISTFTAALVILFLGCHHTALAYVLHRDGFDPIVFPPTRVDNSAKSLSVEIKKARLATPRIDCDIPGDLISLHWLGRTANLSFHSQAFFASSSDQSPNQLARGMFVDPLLAIDRFRLALAERQARGCLRSTENERLRRAIVEDFPLPPAIAYFLQMGSYDITGYFDLTPDFRMQITSPIYPIGVKPSAKTLLGYETANYTFVREGSDGRTRLRLASATEMLIGAESTEIRTLHNQLPFSTSPAHFRLLFMTDETTSDRITRAVLLSASDESKLTQAVAHRVNRPDDFCTAFSIASVNCTILPKNFGVSPELHVRVNHKDAFVRIGGTLQEALNLENPEAGPPSSLRVLRPFKGRLIPIQFDPSSGDILRLVLLPGDQITF